MFSDEITCPKCFTSGVTILEKIESKHLDNGVFYRIIELTLVCKKGCWHNWDEYYKVTLKDFNEDERIVKLPFFRDEIINPNQINFKKE